MSCNAKIGKFFRCGGHSPAGQKILCDVCEDKQLRRYGNVDSSLKSWSADSWEDWDEPNGPRTYQWYPRTCDVNDW